MQEIAPDLYTVNGLLMGRVYLIRDGRDLTLVDASISPSAPKILKAIEGLGHQPQDLKRILLTHAHYDHVGAIEPIVKATGAEVWASAQEADVLEGRIPVVQPKRSDLKGINKLFLPPTSWIKPTHKVTRILSDGDVLPVMGGGLTVLATPGHAPGHLAFWHPERKILILGDVIFHMLDRLTLPLEFFTADMALDRQQVRKLIDLHPAIVCFGHGRPLTTGVQEKLEAFASRIGV